MTLPHSRRVKWLAWGALLTALVASGCECGRDISVGYDVDGGMAEPDADRYLDAGDRFRVRDAEPVGPACSTERITAELPYTDEYYPAVFVHDDQVMVVRVQGSGPEPSELVFFLGPLEGPYEEIARWTHEPDRVVFMHGARIHHRDGAWDVLMEEPNDSRFVWLRLFADGQIEEHLVDVPGGRELYWPDWHPLGDGYLLLGREAALPGDPVRLVYLTREGAERLDPDIPLGADEVWALVPRPDTADALLVAHDVFIGDSPRVQHVRLDPLRLEGDWIEMGTFGRNDYVHYRLHHTPTGWVSTNFYSEREGGSQLPRRLVVRWLDESFRSIAEWSTETIVLGEVSVLGGHPTQEFIVTLPDSADAPQGTATVFHGRSTAPGAMGTLVPIARTLAHAPPAPWVLPDGRWGLLHWDDRVEIEVLCAAD